MRKNELLGELAQCQPHRTIPKEEEAEKPGGAEHLPRVCNTSKGIVPGQEGGQHAEDATGLLQAKSGSGGAIVLGEFGAEEEQEGEVQGEEEAEEHDGGAQGAEQQDGGEDEPAGQEEADGAGLGAFFGVGVRDAERGREDESVRDPEAAVRGEGGGTKCVPNGHLPAGQRHDRGQRTGGRAGGGEGKQERDSPHAGQELDEPAIAKGQGDDDVGGGDAAGLEVDGGEDKGGQGEGAEAEGGRVGQLAALDGLVQAGLELTTKGREAGLVAAVGVGEGVAVVVVARGGLRIVVGTVGLGAGGVGDVLLDVCVRHFGRPSASWRAGFWGCGSKLGKRSAGQSSGRRDRDCWGVLLTGAGCWGRTRGEREREVKGGGVGRRGGQDLI